MFICDSSYPYTFYYPYGISAGFPIDLDISDILTRSSGIDREANLNLPTL